MENDVMNRDPYELLYNARKQLKYLTRAIEKHSRYLNKRESRDWSGGEAVNGYDERTKRNQRHFELWRMEKALHNEIQDLENEIYIFENGDSPNDWIQQNREDIENG